MDCYKTFKYLPFLMNVLVQSCLTLSRRLRKTLRLPKNVCKSFIFRKKLLTCWTISKNSSQKNCIQNYRQTELFADQLNHLPTNWNVCRPTEPLADQLNRLPTNWTTCRPTEPFADQLNRLPTNWTVCRPTEPLADQLNHLPTNWTVCRPTEPFADQLNRLPTNWTICRPTEPLADQLNRLPTNWTVCRPTEPPKTAWKITTYQNVMKSMETLQHFLLSFGCS